MAFCYEFWSNKSFMQKVTFNYADGSFAFNGKTKLKLFIESIFNSEGIKLKSLNYVFCSDKFLLNINQTFLQHDDYTDIITFDFSEKKGIPPIEGEIYISTQRVKENAGLFKTSIKHEMLRVIFHGALHLCGYKDKNKKELQLMRSKEDYYLSKFN